MTERSVTNGRCSVSDVPGIVEPQCLYTNDELLRRMRWNKGSLRKARRSGLRCRYHGRQLFFIGRDVIDYIDQHGKDER